MNNLQLISVVAIIRYKNKYLLVQRHPGDKIFPGKWQNLGGKVEPGDKGIKALLNCQYV